MSTISDNIFTCPAGHGERMPWNQDSITSWCEQCRKQVVFARKRPALTLTPQESEELSHRIAGRIQQLQTTWEEALQGTAVALEPDPKTEKEREVVAKLKGAMFPVRHIARLKTMDREGMQDARKINDLLNQPGPRIIVLYGDYGTGKTQLATAVAMLRSEAKRFTRYVIAQDLTRALRDNFDSKIPEAQLLARYHECPGLMMDEIQAALDESPDRQAWARTQIQGIVDKRYSAGSPLKTILICNAENEESLKRRLGGHIISRVQEAGTIIHVKRRNYRTKPAA